MGKFAIRAALAADREELLCDSITLGIYRRLSWLARVARRPEPRRGVAGDIASLAGALRSLATSRRHASPNGRRSGAPRIVHLIGSLQPGGAERQLCNFLVEAHRRGHSVELLLIYDSTDEQGHFQHLLGEAGIPVRVAGRQLHPLVRIPSCQRPILRLIPSDFFVPAADILGDLLANPPDVFHSWLDHPNIWGGIPAVIAGVPRVVLSTRNVNPTNFPYLASPYMQPLYEALAESPSVRFINNSHAGARDYAEWLGLPPERFSVVLNGVQFDDLRRAGDEEVRAFRNSLGVTDDARLIAGIFRLSEEKQPLVFLEVIRRLALTDPQVHAVIAGVGPLQEDLEGFVREHDLGKRVFLLGRRPDVATILSASSLMLLTSRKEGTPNVLLEAQWLGCPVVSTRAGGAVDAVADGRSGLLVDVGDVDGLESAARELLGSQELARRMSEAGPGFVKARFDIDRMVDETLNVYEGWKDGA
jgi:glycosyltransferase involved in cell wall biosynthesis